MEMARPRPQQVDRPDRKRIQESRIEALPQADLPGAGNDGVEPVVRMRVRHHAEVGRKPNPGGIEARLLGFPGQHGHLGARRQGWIGAPAGVRRKRRDG